LDTNTQEPFTQEERTLISELDGGHLPKHIAIIMDGNGRWATHQGLPRIFGHQAGVDSVRRTIETCLEFDAIEFVTLYSFSTENWSRPADEVAGIMGLIEQQMRQEAIGLHRQGVRIRHLGRMQGLPASLQNALLEIQQLTQANTALTVQFAINYSGRAELVDAARQVAAAVAQGSLAQDAITEDVFAAALYHPDVPDPDLLLRTAGEMRVSNYLLWQIAYSEMVIIPELWPDFHACHLLHALQEYQSRQRKFGGVQS
jgi:undecaprenyl diphosphate synthase